MQITKSIYVTTANEWRGWLEKHHATEKEIWLIYYKKDSGKKRIPYHDAVEQAICFGWIDSTLKKHTPESTAQRFTPRKNIENWSEPNKIRARALIEQNQMTKAGLEAMAPSVRAELEKPEKHTHAQTIAKDIVAELKQDNETWKNYCTFPKSYQNIRIAWIEAARYRPEIFAQRLGYFIRMTKKNKRYGMMESKNTTKNKK